MWPKIIPWLFAALLIVVVLGVWRTVRDSRSLTLPEQVAPVVVPKPATSVTLFPVDPKLGNQQGSVTIIEFSDFACPFCAETAPVIKQAAAAYQNVMVVWKDFPLPSHTQAVPAAEAAQCAARQGKFWEYHDSLFANQDRLGTELYSQIAQELKLSLNDFSLCRSEHRTLPLIQRNVAEGTAVGVDGTPYIIVNGLVHSGTITAPELDSLIRAASGS